MAGNAEQLRELTKNFLGRQLYVIHTTPNARREELDRILPRPSRAPDPTGEIGHHVRGGSHDESGRHPRRRAHRHPAKDFAEAKAIAGSDPFHKTGLRSYTLRCWTVNEGSYGLCVNYSDQTVTIE